MTDASLDDLTPEFHDKVVQLLQNLSALGYELVPYFTLRTPMDQAELWRQSRVGAEIDQKVATLRALGAQWLSGVLAMAPHRTGPWATNGVPGNSWHQWGQAVDCYLKLPTGVQWHDAPGYVVYANEAVKLGLTVGRDFTRPDIDHVQFLEQGAPSDLYSWPDIDARMKERFSNAQR